MGGKLTTKNQNTNKPNENQVAALESLPGFAWPQKKRTA
jgi:hypothetical protein